MLYAVLKWLSINLSMYIYEEMENSTYIYTQAQVKISAIFHFLISFRIRPLTFSPHGAAEITYGNKKQDRATNSKNSFSLHVMLLSGAITKQWLRVSTVIFHFDL